MGNVDIQKIPPLKIRELTGVEPLRVSQVTGVEPIRIGQIAPAAVHVKELNHIDPITVESLRVDHVRNLDPLRVESFDVTHLPTVDVSVSRFPAMDLSLRRMPPIAVALQQEFCLPSRYRIHARLLGIEVLRFDVHGTTELSPRDRVPRERARTHEQSFPTVAAAGNPGIPLERTGTVDVARACTATRHACPEQAAPKPRADPMRRPAALPAGRTPGSGLSVGAPLFSYSAQPERTVDGSAARVAGAGREPATGSGAGGGGSVSWGGD